MLYPRLFGETLFDDFFRFPYIESNMGKKLYGKHVSQIMKTDVQEHEDHYEIMIDLPGFKKEQIQIELQDENLIVSATKGIDKQEQSEEGRLIRQERYAGSMQRSFYVGKSVSETDIHAKFEDGVLNISIPKKEENPSSNRKYIEIHG